MGKCGGTSSCRCDDRGAIKPATMSGATAPCSDMVKVATRSRRLLLLLASTPPRWTCSFGANPRGNLVPGWFLVLSLLFILSKDTSSGFSSAPQKEEISFRATPEEE
jgi:hypothetical protein